MDKLFQCFPVWLYAFLSICTLSGDFSHLFLRLSICSSTPSQLGPIASQAQGPLGPGVSQLGPRVNQPGPWTSQPGSRVIQPGPRTSQLGPKASETGPASQAREQVSHKNLREDSGQDGKCLFPFLSLSFFLFLFLFLFGQRLR